MAQISAPTWDDLVRVLTHCIETEAGCWEWQRGKSSGYGKVWHRPTRSVWYTHRLVHSVLCGLPPSRMDIDHLCRNRACCNPAHLEPVPHQLNADRGDWLKPRGVCKNGHPYTDDNVRWSGDKKVCLACYRMTQDRHKSTSLDPARFTSSICVRGHVDDWSWTSLGKRKCRPCARELAQRKRAHAVNRPIAQ